jgi:hypothetical protein
MQNDMKIQAAIMLGGDLIFSLWWLDVDQSSKAAIWRK